MIGRLGATGKWNDQSKFVEGRSLGVGVGKVENQLPRRRWRTGKDEEKGHHLFGNGGNDPVLMGHIVVGPAALPSRGVDVLPGLVGILEDECIALLSPKPKVLIVGCEVKDVLPEMDAKRSGAFVLDLNGKIDIGDSVFGFNDGGLRIEFQRRVSPNGAGREKNKTEKDKEKGVSSLLRQSPEHQSTFDK